MSAQLILEILDSGIGKRKRFIRTRNAYKDLNHFINQANNLQKDIKIDLSENVTREQYILYIEQLADFQCNLKAVYLFSEIFLNAFVSDICGKETTFNSFLFKKDFHENLDIKLPEIEKLIGAYTISVYRGKFIGHQKFEALSSKIYSPKGEVRMIFSRLSEMEKTSVDTQSENNPDYNFELMQIWKSVAPKIKIDHFQGKLFYLFMNTPIGNWGWKSDNREKINKLVGEIGLKSHTLKEIQDALFGFINVFKLENI